MIRKILFTIVVFVGIVRWESWAFATNSTNAHIKVEVILDSQDLRFPEPIFGFVRITNTSTQKKLFPSSLSGNLLIKVGDIEVEQLVTQPAAQVFGVSDVEQVPLHSITVPFLYCISDKKQVNALLAGNETVEFQFLMAGIANPRSIEEAFGVEENQVERSEIYETVYSPTVKVHYSLEHLVFKDRIDKNFALKALDPTSWPRRNPFTLRVPISQSSEKYPIFFYDLGMKDGFLFDHIPVVRLFPRHIRYLQTVIRCDTATWRFLEIARIGQFKSSRPESPENRLQTHDDFVKVLRCMGRAEAYYHYPGVRDQNYFGNDEIFIDGKRWNLAEYIAERDTIELPVLFARIENPEYSKTNRDAQGREEQRTVHRYIWKSLINDTTLPSPREATIKRWIDGGKQGPNPCPCWNEEDDAKVQIPVPVPDDGEKTDVNP